jgi:hypothetical protein
MSINTFEIDTVELAEKHVSENFNDPTVQSLFTQAGQSKEQFTKNLAANLIKIQESDEKSLDLQARDVPFPIRKTFPLDGIATFDVTVDREGSGYYVEIDTHIMGYDIGKSRLDFQNGVLSRHESAGNNSLGSEYWVSLQVSGGFSVSLRVHAWIHILFVSKDVQGGPWNLP